MCWLVVVHRVGAAFGERDDVVYVERVVVVSVCVVVDGFAADCAVGFGSSVGGAGFVDDGVVAFAGRVHVLPPCCVAWCFVLWLVERRCSCVAELTTNAPP